MTENDENALGEISPVLESFRRRSEAAKNLSPDGVEDLIDISIRQKLLLDAKTEYSNPEVLAHLRMLLIHDVPALIEEVAALREKEAAWMKTCCSHHRKNDALDQLRERLLQEASTELARLFKIIKAVKKLDRYDVEAQDDGSCFDEDCCSQITGGYYTAETKSDQGQYVRYHELHAALGEMA